MIAGNIADWAEEELDTIELGDKRLNVRAKVVLTCLGAAPASPIAAAVGGGRAETEGAYRLFENERFGFHDILEPHIESTLKRVGQESVCVLGEDTTEADLTRPNRQVEGSGPLDAGTRFGFLLHEIHAFTETGIALGTVDAKVIVRDKKDEVEAQKPKPTKDERREILRATPIEKKESIRWVEGIQTAHEVAVLCPQTQIIIVSDSESDIFEVLSEGQAHQRLKANDTDALPHAEFVVRACQDRRVVAPEVQKDDSNTSEDSVSEVLPYVFSQAESSPVIHTYEIHVRGREPKVGCEERGRRQPRESRTATVEVRACQITLQGLKRQGKKLSDVVVNAVLVREANPPSGDVAIEWLLLTSLPITNEEDVLRVISIYCLRWQIEIFFRVLKQGCRIEERLFETMSNVERYLGIALIISWRTLYLSRLGRETPNVSCESIFDESEWKSVYQVTQKKEPPQTPPTLGEVIRMVAQLGGYVNRKHGAYPGPETIWKGLQRMYDLATGWETFGPGRLKG